VHTVYVASLPPAPVWLLNFVYSGVAVFMFAAHLWWSPASRSGGSSSSFQAPTARSVMASGPPGSGAGLSPRSGS
jgi:hypothetical protein